MQEHRNAMLRGPRSEPSSARKLRVMSDQNIEISVRNLKKSFGDNKVLNGIDFDLYDGEKVVVLGPSGSGKSTFLRCINRLEEPTTGEVFFENTLISDANVREMRAKIGMVFQHFNLISNLTVMENLTLAPVKVRKTSLGEAEKKARSLLRHIGLSSKADAYPASLSGGQKQRVAIIRALMMDPEVLLFDEPTSALDPESIGDVRGSSSLSPALPGSGCFLSLPHSPVLCPPPNLLLASQPWHLGLPFLFCVS